MTPKWTSALAAVIALALSGISPPSSATESLDTAAAHQVYSQGAKADYLAGYHMKNKLTANCSACHPTDAVSDSQSEIDKNCTACHGTYDALGKKDHSARMPDTFRLTPARLVTADTKLRSHTATTAMYLICR